MRNYDDNEEFENYFERDMISKSGKLRSEERTNLLCLVGDVKFQLRYLRSGTSIMRYIESHKPVNELLKDSVVRIMVNFCNDVVNLLTRVPGVEDLAWKLSVQVVREVFPNILTRGTEAELRMKLGLHGMIV